MALSIEKYKELKANNGLFWDTDAIGKTGENVSSFLSGVQQQMTAQGAQWTQDEFGTQRMKIEDLRNQLRYMHTYADSIKDSDAAAYDGLMKNYNSLSSGLDEAEKWFNGNQSGAKRTEFFEMTKKARSEAKQALGTAAAVDTLRKGHSTAAEQAEKYGLNANELESTYKGLRAEEKAQDRENRYKDMGAADLMGLLKSPDSLGKLIYDEVKSEYGNGLKNAVEFDKNSIYRTKAQKYGLTEDEVRTIVERMENHDDHHYDSYALSNEDRAYIAQRIIETGSLEELKELKQTLPSAKYYDSIRYRLKDAIEEKSEERYYTEIAERYPRVTQIMEQVAAIDKELPSLASTTGAPVGHKGQFNNIMDAQETRAAYMRELEAAGFDGEKMVKYYKRRAERLENEERQKAIKDWTSQNGFNAALASVASIPINMIGSVGDLPKIFFARMDELAGNDGWYDPKGTANYTAQNIRGTTTEMIDEATKNAGVWNYLAKELYSAGMSGGDMVLAAAANAIPIVGQSASNMMFFSSAGVNAANEVVENGGDLAQATKALIAGGGAELLFERISLDKLEKFAVSGNVTDANEYFKGILKRMFVEGSEEFNTTLANTFTDALINGGNNQIDRTIRQLEEQGYSVQDAKGAAWKQWAQGIINDAVGGALSGGVFGGIAGAQNAAAWNQVIDFGNQALTRGQVENLLSESNGEAVNEAKALIKDMGIDAVLKQAEKSEDAQTRRTAEHFAALEKDGKLDRDDAAQLLVKVIKERAATDAVARMAGVQTTGEHEATVGRIAQQLNGFDYAGNRLEKGMPEIKSSFGVQHPNGIAAELNGKSVTVVSIESSMPEYLKDDNTVSVKLSDGTVIDADGLTFNNPDFDRLMNLAKNYDTLGARALLSNYETAAQGGVSVDRYIQDFNRLYELGQSGGDFRHAAQNAYYTAAIEDMGETAAQAAIAAGLNDGDISSATMAYFQRKVRIKGKAFSKSRVSVERDVKFDVDGDAGKVLQMIAEKTGKEIVLTNALNSDDKARYSSNTIFVNANQAEHAMVAAALHEAVHNLRAYSAGDFRTLQKFVTNYLTESGKNIQQELDSIAAVYGKDAPTPDVVMEELVCKSIEALAADKDALELALTTKKNRPIIKEVGEILKRIADRVMSYFKGDREKGELAHNRYAQAFLDDAKALREMAELVSKGFDNAQESEAKYGSGDSGVSYDIGAFDKSNPDIRYSKDDTIYDKPYNQYSLKKIEHFIAIGEKYKDLSVHEFIDKVFDYGISALPFLSLGYDNPGFKPVVKTYYRIGEPRLADDGTYKNSYNFADDKPEEGVSVVTTGWLHSFKSVFFGVSDEDLKKRGVYKMFGFELPSKGGDDEKLIIPLDWAEKTNITTKEALEAAVAASERQSAKADDTNTQGGLKSKDDTIYDDDFEQAWWDSVAGEKDDYFDTYGLFEDASTPENEVDIERLMNDEDPGQVIYKLSAANARLSEKALRNYSVKLSDEQYQKIARRMMRKYGIKEKYNPELVSEIAETTKNFLTDIKKRKKGDFGVLMNSLATSCRRYLENSGDYTRGVMEDVAKDIIGYLRGATLIVTPYAQSHVLDSYDGSLKQLRNSLKGYVHVGLEKDIARYQRPIYMDDLIDAVSDMTASSSSLGEVSPLFPNGERPDSLSGWNWLRDLVDGVLRPQFQARFNNSNEMYYESIDAAAAEMATDIVSELVGERVESMRTRHGADQKALREINDEHRKALSLQKILSKAREVGYKKEIERIKQREMKQRGLKEMALEDLDTLKRFVKSDTQNFRAQYLKQQQARKDIESVRRNMAKIRTMVMNPTNEKFIPPEILHNSEFLNAFEALGEGIVLNNRSQVAAKMEPMLREIRNLRAISLKYDGDTDSAFDDGFMEQLTSIGDWLASKESEGEARKISRKAFSSDELSELRQMVDEIMYRIENARKLLLRKDGMTAREASDKVIAETRAMDTNKAKKIFAGFSEMLMNPLRTVNHLSGYNENSELRKLFYDLNEGQRKQWFWQMKAEKMFAEVVEKHEDAYKTACNEVVHYDYTVDGKGYHLDMTRMQALQVLMTWKRESQSRMNHSRRGGIVVADPKAVAKGKGDKWANAQSAPVGNDLINQIIHSLGKFENEYLLTAEKYFNQVSKDAINETMLVTRHREVARSDYYIPVRVDSDFNKSEISALKFDYTIEGAGSYKHITPHAPQPILIESLNSVIERHINQTGKLYGLDIPLINFKRMFKGTTSMPGENTAWFKPDSVKKALSEKFGPESVRFIEGAITELESGRESKTDKFGRVGEFLYTTKVKTSLVGNLGVVIKQAASYPTAGLYLSAGDLNVGLAKFFFGHKEGNEKAIHFYQKTINEIDKYTAQHYIRRKGLSVQEVADMFRSSKTVRKAPTVINPVKWIQGMDCLTTAALWEATKANVNREYKKSGKQVESDAYWKDVTALYDTIIEDTQPMYDALHRSEFQKGGGTMRKMLLPFKTQPLQNMGILADAASEFVQKRDKASAKKLAKAASSQVSSLLVFSLMTFAAAWSRHRDDRYKDENDELTFAGVAPHVLWDMMMNAVNNALPVGGEYGEALLEDTINSFIDGKLRYKRLSEVTEISIVNDIFTKISSAVNVLNEQLDGTNKAKVNPWDFMWKVLDVPGSISEIFGLPYSNVSTLFKGFGNRVKDSYMYGPVNNKGNLKTDHIAEHILKAYDSGNKTKGDELTEMWVQERMSKGKEEGKAREAVEKKLIEALAAREDVQEAAELSAGGNFKKAEELTKRLSEKGVDEGLIDKAVKKAKNLLDNDEAEGTEKADSADSTDSKNTPPQKYQLKDAFAALKNGETDSYEQVKGELAQWYVDTGQKENIEEAEKHIESQMRSANHTDSLFEELEAATDGSDKARLDRIWKQLENVFGSRNAALEAYGRYKERKNK